MSNMSYCRFQNTAGDFADCKETLEQLIAGGEEPLSREELYAAKRLVRLAYEMVQSLVEAGDLDVDVMDDEDLQRVVELANADAKKDWDEEQRRLEAEDEAVEAEAERSEQ